MNSTEELAESEVSANIVERVLARDANAEQEMVLRYQRGLKAMLYNKCADTALSDDVAQETWLLVIQKVRGGELRDNRRLASFIIQIAKNQLIMKFRASNRNQYSEQDLDLEIEDKSHTPEQKIINQQLASSISEVLGELRKPRDRELIRKFYLIGEEKSDLCKEYNLTEAHFDRVLFRARERFKLLVEKKPSLFK